MKLAGTLPRDSQQLVSTDFATWGNNAHYHELSEVRDIKELQFLTRLLSELGQDQQPRCADLICMQIREIRMAKKKDGCGWDKAASISLMPSSVAPNAAFPAGTFAL